MSLDPSELAAIQALAFPYFVSPVNIYRPSLVPEDPDAPGYDPATDYGDDEWDAPQGSPETLIGTALGWLFAEPEMNTLDGGGQIAAINAHELRVPVGTDVRPHDIVEVGEAFAASAAGGDRWTVIDSNNETTWPDMMRVGLRRRSD